MSKKLLERPEHTERPERPERQERRREMYRQGDEVFARHLSYWSKGTFIDFNRDGTLRIKIGKGPVNLKAYDVAPIDRR